MSKGRHIDNLLYDLDRLIEDIIDEAERVFDRMLWLNPPDNQGVRFLIDEVRAKSAWEERENE